jgi:hypothetical protein
MADPRAERAPHAAVGHLTTKPRADWAASRRSLLRRLPGNADQLDTIETALFCLCLEESAPREPLAACDHLLHGDSANRWFDKSVSIVVFADGNAGLNVEHSCVDGLTIVDFVDLLFSQATDDHSRQSGACAQGRPRFGWSSSTPTQPCWMICAAPRHPSQRQPLRRRPLCCHWVTSVHCTPNSSGSLRMRSSRWRSNSRTSGQRGRRFHLRVDLDATVPPRAHGSDAGCHAGGDQLHQLDGQP